MCLASRRYDLPPTQRLQDLKKMLIHFKHINTLNVFNIISALKVLLNGMPCTRNKKREHAGYLKGRMKYDDVLMFQGLRGPVCREKINNKSEDN